MAGPLGADGVRHGPRPVQRLCRGEAGGAHGRERRLLGRQEERGPAPGEWQVRLPPHAALQAREQVQRGGDHHRQGRGQDGDPAGLPGLGRAQPPGLQRRRGEGVPQVPGIRGQAGDAGRGRRPRPGVQDAAAAERGGGREGGAHLQDRPGEQAHALLAPRPERHVHAPARGAAAARRGPRPVHPGPPTQWPCADRQQGRGAPPRKPRGRLQEVPGRVQPGPGVRAAAEELRQGGALRPQHRGPGGHALHEGGRGAAARGPSRLQLALLRLGQARA
mmetsp:Transcript_12706/g.39417  ORF Transcript_12706/g.39417 Transcript_12706/m.39417 type:complete len:276 (+) Transcript_12706:3-830(+)